MVAVLLNTFGAFSTLFSSVMPSVIIHDMWHVLALHIIDGITDDYVKFD